MNRQELQKISNIRRREAAALIKVGQYAGAYYLLGYSVECALKACIAKQTNRHDFPNKTVAQKSYVHNLEQLLKVAGLEPTLRQDMAANTTLELNWTVVKDWKETSRYTANITKNDAKDLYSACTSRTNGVLKWIRGYW